MATPAYIPIYTTTLASATSSVLMAGIPQDYRDLVVVFSGTFASFSSPALRFNGDSSSSYSYVYMQKSGTGTNSNAGTTTRAWMLSANYDTGVGQTTFQVLDYSSTDKHKPMLVRDSTSRTDNGVTAYAVRWADTSAITSVEVLTFSSFQAGTTISLYGILGTE